MREAKRKESNEKGKDLRKAGGAKEKCRKKTRSVMEGKKCETQG